MSTEEDNVDAVAGANAADAGGEDGAAGAGMAADDRDGPVDGLVSRLRVIEDQPLESRASAFTQVHDELQHTLEGGDAQRRHA